MDFFTVVYSNPLYYIGALLAAYGAMGFVRFMSGAFTGAHHTIMLDGHRDHMNHYRHRIRQGLGFMVEAFFVWEIIRLLGDWLSGNPITNGGIVTFMVVLYILVLIGSLITGTKPEAAH